MPLYTSPRDFDVAIVCALPGESDPIKNLLDYEYLETEHAYGKAPRDNNTYTYGQLGRHNVVLCHMPGMGKASSSSVTAMLRMSFPGIRLCLVVGICGGVPKTPDGQEILLGDVIISTGIIEYDFRRRFPNKAFRKASILETLSRPAVEIRGHLAKLQGRQNLARLIDSTAAYLSDLQQDSMLRSLYPGIVADKLYESSYRHKHQDPTICRVCANCHSQCDPVCEASITTTCTAAGCDDSKLIPRKRIEELTLSFTSRKPPLRPAPTIHFGLVASGDEIMRSAQNRDEIAAMEKVIAFEMEGAGAWDNLPVLVIKGVCDYADSHKNKDWQPYAAVTAAACVKAFLETWPVTDRSRSWPSPPDFQTLDGKANSLQEREKRVEPPKANRILGLLPSPNEIIRNRFGTDYQISPKSAPLFLLAFWFLFTSIHTILSASSASQVPLFELEKQQLGLKKLYEGDRPMVDIIVVGRDGANQAYEWRADNNVSWVNGLLGNEFSQARILSYHWRLHSLQSRDMMKQSNIPEMLVTDIINYRHSTSTDNIPIIFIAHGVGGILVKSALRYSSISNDDTNRRLKLLTRGILFFGTPHEGASGWRYLAMQLILLSPFAMSAEWSLIHLLVNGADFLQQQLTDYVNLASDIPTLFFYETQPLAISPWLSLPIVPYSSAVIPGLAGAKAVALDANHASMVRFSGTQDSNYRRVIYHLSPLIENSENGIIHDITPKAYHSLKSSITTASQSYQLPLRLPFPRNMLFTGRDIDLKKLNRILSPDHNSMERSIAVVYGTQGMGKSQLALEYAYSYHKDYTAILYANARTTSTLDGDIMSLASSIEPHWKEPFHERTNTQTSLEDVKETTRMKWKAWQIVKDWLSRPGNDGWLLILDNLDSQRNEITELLSFVTQGKVIITTLITDFKRMGSGSVEIDKMDPASARALLCASAGDPCTNKKTIQAADVLALELGYLPLALDQVGAYIDVQQISFSTCLEQYRNNFADIAPTKPSHWEYGDTLWSAWEMTFQLIQNEDRNGTTCSTSMLLWISYLSPDKIHPRLLEAFLNGFYYTYSGNLCSVSATLRVLMRYSIIKRTARDEEFSIHPVVQNWIRQQFSIDYRAEFIGQALVFFFTNLETDLTLHQLSEYFSSPSDNSQALEPQQTDVPREENNRLTVLAASNAFEYLYTLSVTEKREMRLDLLSHLKSFMQTLQQDFGPNMGDLYRAASHVFTQYGRLRDAEANLLLYRAFLAEEAPAESSCQNFVEADYYLANIYFLLGKGEEAKELLGQFFLVCGGVENVADPHMLTVGILVASMLSSLGDFEGVETILNPIQERMKNQQPGENWLSKDNKRVVRKTLAWMAFIRGEETEAAVIQTELLDEAREEYGEQNPITIQISNELALSYFELGRLNAARSLLESVVAQQELLLGPTHPNTLIYKSNLAMVYGEQAEYDLALPLAEAIVNCWQSNYRDHPSSKVSIADLVHLYQRMGVAIVERKKFEDLDISEVESMDRATVYGLRRGLTSSVDLVRVIHWVLLFLGVVGAIFLSFAAFTDFYFS